MQYNSLTLATILAISIASTAHATPINPLAVYTFDAGDATDSSGNGNHGTISGSGGTTFTADGLGHGGIGRAMDSSVFSGITGIDTGINIDDSVLPAMTMGAWVKARSAGGRGIGKFLSHDDGSFDRTVGVDVRGNNSGLDYAAFTGRGVADGTAGVVFDIWTHVVVTYDGTVMNLFRDGVLARTATDYTDNDNTRYNLFIGTNPGFEEDWDGLIDDAFVYGRALSGADVADIYRNGFGPAAVPGPAGIPLLLGGIGLLSLRRRQQS